MMFLNVMEIAKRFPALKNKSFCCDGNREAISSTQKSLIFVVMKFVKQISAFKKRGFLL
jgi:hypothetical protein